MSQIDQKDMDLYKKKESEFNQSVKSLKTKREDFDKKQKGANIDAIKKNVEKIKKLSEEIKTKVEEEEKRKKEEDNKEQS